AETAGLSYSRAGKVEASESGRKAEIVLDSRTQAGLASWRFAFDDYRAQAFARAVDSGGKPGGTTADNGKIVEVGLGVCAKPDFIRNGWKGGVRKASRVGI